MSVPKPLSIFIVFLLSLVVWISALVVAGRSGFPTRLLLCESCYRPTFELTRLAFKYKDLHKPEYVIIGTDEFIEHILERIDSSKTYIAVPIQKFKLKQIADIQSIFSEKQPTWFIVQNAPILWVDVLDENEIAIQDTLGWRLYRDKLKLNPIRFALKNLEFIFNLSSTPCQNKEKQYRLPEHFLWASFLPEQMLSENLQFHNVTSAVEEKTWWVFDPSWIPEDTMKDTYQSLINFCLNTQHVPGLGRFVSLEDIESAF